MRTTLNIEDSVLNAVKDLARRQGKTVGEVISILARQALLQGAGEPAGMKSVPVSDTPGSYGFRPLPTDRAPLVSNAVIDKLRGELGV